MAKLYDLAVVVGSYTNRSGEEKKRWKNIGSVIQTKDGGKVILIDRTFNPAGVPVEDGRDQIMVSMFAPNEADGSASKPASKPQPSGGSGSFDDFDSDMQF